MEKVKVFIDLNFNEFSNLDDSEVIHYSIQDLDLDIVEYLKGVDRFDYKGICIYYVERVDEIWVENMM